MGLIIEYGSICSILTVAHMFSLGIPELLTIRSEIKGTKISIQTPYWTDKSQDLLFFRFTEPEQISRIKLRFNNKINKFPPEFKMAKIGEKIACLSSRENIKFDTEIYLVLLMEKLLLIKGLLKVLVEVQ